MTHTHICPICDRGWECQRDTLIDNLDRRRCPDCAANGITQRITLIEDRFRALCRGEIVTVNDVAIKLADIGFDRMEQAVHDAEAAQYDALAADAERARQRRAR